MRWKYQFETMKLDDRTVAVPVGNGAQCFRGVIKLDDTAERIFELLKSDTSEEMIINSLAEEYDVSRETITQDVHAFITKFQEKGLLIS